MGSQLSPAKVLLNELGKRDLELLTQADLGGFSPGYIAGEVFLYRLLNAQRHLYAAEVLESQNAFTASITRSYYASYNALRGFAFYTYKHDKYGSHSNLQANIPATLPNCAAYANELQNMRVTRNECDYDVCLTEESTYSGRARHYIKVSAEIINSCFRSV